MAIEGFFFMNQTEWVSIARLANLAEVGYFEDVLVGADIELRVQEHDDFDAVAGNWQRVYVIQVPLDQGQSASELIDDYLRRSAALVDGETADEASRERPMSLWKPFALVLLASGLVYLAVQAGNPRQGPRAAKEKDMSRLWDVLIETDGVLRDKHRQLRYDRLHRRLIIDDDLDGDGRFDLRREFVNGREVREIQLKKTTRP